MRILHTADWHVGKTLKNHNRHEEHTAVLADLVTAAADEDVDLVLVAGDLFDTTTPSPESQQLVMGTLLNLSADGRTVVVQAGNHDNARQLEVFRPLLGRLGITVVGLPRSAADGGALQVRVRSGEQARIAVLPFVSQRYAVRAAEAMTNTAADNNRAYAELYGRMVGALTDGFDHADAVNVVMAHATLVGGAPGGGGERASQTIFDYYVPATVFPSSTHYVALGHLHRRQQIPSNVPVHYSGSPLQVDFGETENTPVAVVVDVSDDTPAITTDRPVAGGRRLRTVRATLEELEQLTVDETDWLRVYVKHKHYAGLADDVREMLPNAIEVRLDEAFAPQLRHTSADEIRERAGRTPHRLFTDYLATQARADTDQLTGLFATLLDQVHTADAADLAGELMGQGGEAER